MYCYKRVFRYLAGRADRMIIFPKIACGKKDLRGVTIAYALRCFR